MIEKIKEYYYTRLQNINLSAEDLEMYGETMLKNDLHNFTEIRPKGMGIYLVHNELVPFIDDPYLFIKSLFYANYIKETTLSKYVYSKDKKCNLVARDFRDTDDIVDRLDTFICGPADGSYRRYGTIHGSIKYGLVQDAKFRELNKIFLRTLHNGPDGHDIPIKCIFNGLSIESKTRFSYTRNTEILYDEYEIHHVLLKDNSSYFFNPESLGLVKKIGEPSKHITSKLYTEFDNKIISEFLGCMLLSVNEHSNLHKLETTDGIDRWLERYKNGLCISLPYAWKSEENYNNIIKWIGKNCPRVDTSILLTFEEFIKAHSVSALDIFYT